MRQTNFYAAAFVRTYGVYESIRHLHIHHDHEIRQTRRKKIICFYSASLFQCCCFFSISFSTQICSSPFYLQLLNTRNRIRGIIFFFNYDSVVIKCFRMKRCYLYVPLLCKFAGLLTCYCNKCNMPVVRINQRCSTSVYRV